MFLTFSATSGVVFTMKALIIVVMGGVGNLLGCLVAGLALGLSEALVATFVDPGLTLAVNFALFLRRAAGETGRPVRAGAAMTPWRATFGAAMLAGLIVLALLPAWINAYHLALAISLLQFTILATAWGMFSGPTRYVSLATTAFFGVGAYTVAVLGEVLSWPLVLAIAARDRRHDGGDRGPCRRCGSAACILSSSPSVSPNWCASSWSGSRSTNPACSDVTCSSISPSAISTGSCWRWPSPCFVIGFFIARSRLGFALRIIGEDETVAQHCGIDTTVAKVALFTISATAMALVGAIMAPRWTYIEPSIAFNATISFQVVIMALLGGAHRLWGPVLGAVPLTLLFEFLTARFPSTSTLFMGIVFLLIVYALPIRRGRPAGNASAAGGRDASMPQKVPT